MKITSYGTIEKKVLSDGEIEFIVSTGALDAHGERINVDGISFKEYKNNPVVLWGHNGFDLPIAKTTKIWKENGKLMARAMFDLADDFPRKVYNKIKNGFINAVSIGGMVEEWGDDGITIQKLNMKEFSVVSVPANPEALATAKMSDDEIEMNEMAQMYAQKLLSDKSVLTKEVNKLETLVATLKELTNGETHDESATNTRVVLKQIQAVDNQAEQIIKVVKKRR